MEVEKNRGTMAKFISQKVSSEPMFELHVDVLWCNPEIDLFYNVYELLGLLLTINESPDLYRRHEPLFKSTQLNAANLSNSTWVS